MRWVVIYWLVGCVAAGMSVADRFKKCPNDEIVTTEWVVVAATWPLWGTARYRISHTAGAQMSEAQCLSAPL